MLVELSIIERELGRLNDKSTAEGLTASDCKSLETLVKVRAIILANEKLIVGPTPQPQVNLNNSELRKLLRADDED